MSWLMAASSESTLGHLPSLKSSHLPDAAPLAWMPRRKAGGEGRGDGGVDRTRPADNAFRRRSRRAANMVHRRGVPDCLSERVSDVLAANLEPHACCSWWWCSAMGERSSALTRHKLTAPIRGWRRAYPAHAVSVSPTRVAPAWQTQRTPSAVPIPCTRTFSSGSKRGFSNLHPQGWPSCPYFFTEGAARGAFVWER